MKFRVSHLWFSLLYEDLISVCGVRVHCFKSHANSALHACWELGARHLGVNPWHACARRASFGSEQCFKSHAKRLQLAHFNFARVQTSNQFVEGAAMVMAFLICLIVQT